jgi:drug/metabolite transporter (DMT)-like permease
MIKNSKALKGSIFIILSAVFFGTYGIWSKLMASSFGEFNQAWIRALILLIILLPFGFLTKKFKKIDKVDIKWFAIISLCGGLNQAPYFFGFKHLPVGTATLLFYLALTIGAYIIGKLFFGEKITKIKYLALFISIIGLTIIYKLSLSQAQILPAVLTMASGLMGAGAVVFSKKISARYSETQILSVLFVAMLAINFPISMVMGEIVPSFSLVIPWTAEVIYSLALLAANALVIAGFKYLEPSIGGILGLLEVVFAAIFGIVFFQEILTIQFIFGSILILIAASLSDVMKLIQAKIR